MQATLITDDMKLFHLYKFHNQYLLLTAYPYLIFLIRIITKITRFIQIYKLDNKIKTAYNTTKLYYCIVLREIYIIIYYSNRMHHKS